jgi:hypothetical protein
MARSQRQVPNIYFGRPGKLVTLPWPQGGIERGADRQTYDFLTGSGLHQISRLAVASRAYQLTWEALHQDTFTLLEQHNLGANGPGPWAFIDPSAPNILPANVAAATGMTLDATDLYTDTINNGVVGSNSTSTFLHRATGSRSIRWYFTDPVITPVPLLKVRPQFRNWAGIPVFPGLQYTFSSWVRVDGTVETSADVGSYLRWMDATGSVLSTTTLTPAARTSTWTRMTSTGTAPAGAAFVDPNWVLTGTTMAVGGSVYIDEPLLEQDSVANDWAPGTGIRPIEITALPESVPFEARFRTNVQMGFRELSK